MHLDKIAKDIKKGERVKKGAAIGTVGRTQDVGGKGTTSPHLHYEVLKPGVSSAGKVATPTSHSQENFGLREDPEKFIGDTGSTVFE
jgi:murein DD-endopeptidase MepM/ murein hydrolase activator NlpD